MPISDQLLAIGNFIHPFLPGLTGGLIGLLGVALQKRHENRSRQTVSSSVPAPHSPVFDQTSKIKQLERRLAGLLHGDRRAMHRILSNLRKTYPKQSALWLYEKAIWDVERDRF